jgi:hypothetical protein
MEKTIKLNTDLSDEVNYNELLDKGRQHVNGEKIQEGLLYINLMLLSPNLDNSSKISGMAIKSYSYYKLKDKNIVMSLGLKTIKFLENQKIEYLENSILFCAVRMLYRAGMLFIENHQTYVGAYCLYYAKKLFEHKALRTEKDSYDTLETTITSVLKTLTSEVKLFLIIDLRI